MKTKEQVTTNGRAVFYTVLWESFRKAALDCGWALGLHGSMAKDMDMMAMKWVEGATPVEDLVKALSDCIDGTVWKGTHFKPFIGKPHNRVVYTLSIFKDFHIDLSVISDEQKDPHEVSNVKCDLCGKEWIAVRPEGLVQLECPNCQNMVHFENI